MDGREQGQPARRSSRGRGWWRVILGLAWLLPASLVVLSRAGVVLAGHPAYAVLVVVVGVLGAVLVALGVRDLAGRRPLPHRRGWLIGVGRSAAALATLAVVGSMLYLRPLGASADALSAMAGSDAVSVTTSATRITLTPVGPERSGASTVEHGLVFQPGARVDPRAYVPLLSRLSAEGVLVVIVKQPLGIGFTAIGAPEGIIADHPEVGSWAVGGHSLGGVAASSYAADAPADEAVDGLLLWASYPLGSLAGRTDLAVTSVYGTEDALATVEDIEASRIDLPPQATFVEIAGGVHAFFGDYGEQPGDGTPTVSRAEAQDQIVAASAELVGSRG